jgi:threonine/homoserine/homoserine lactone efflux protein
MITLLLLFALYFLPTIIASQRGHAVGGILLLNLFFGWTGIGWAALLLYALLSAPRWQRYAYVQRCY